MNFSKSKYTNGCQCPKICWMQKNMPEQFDSSSLNEGVLQTGNEVGDLAMGYFGPFVEVQFDPDDPSRFKKAAAETKLLIDAGEPIICEATFSPRGHYCMVDILRVREDGSFDVTEVKSSTEMKDTYFDDLAYQCWLIEECGYRVNSASLLHIDRTYERHGELDIHGLFTLEDHTSEIRSMMHEIPERLASIAEVADMDSEPEIAIGEQCLKPYECGYRQWCWRNIPQPSAFDISRLRKSRAFELLEEGLVGFDALANNPAAFKILNPKQQNQVLAEVNDLPPFVKTDNICSFLETLTYPLYFLDFETYNEAVPSYEGQHPYEQVTTQYSLHWIENAGGELHHTEFLATTDSDPRRQVAEHLCEDIPRGVCTLAWNMGFEKGRIKDMAKLYPDLADHLMDIYNHIKDLMVPFQAGDYYTKEMQGSSSIKYVLPALFPDDPELDYHALEGIHHGGEAADAFKHLNNHTPEEQAVIREQLLRYCELDTLAMVRIWEHLCETCQAKP